MSLETIVNTQPGQYINGDITGTVKFAKEREGKFGTYQTAVLVVEGLEISAVSDSPVFVNNNDATVTFSGRGMKRKEDFKDKMQIAFGKSVTVSTGKKAEPKTDTVAVVTPSLSADELAKTWADVASKTRHAFVEAGLPEIADNAALRAPEWVSLWWFGQKNIGSK